MGGRSPVCRQYARVDSRNQDRTVREAKTLLGFGTEFPDNAGSNPSAGTTRNLASILGLTFGTPRALISGHSAFVPKPTDYEPRICRSFGVCLWHSSIDPCSPKLWALEMRDGHIEKAFSRLFERT